ncbi:MAG: hypothetical protein A2498_06110 [Lentisphaerae bacterium RIFOXYC12_FULL_60_16]|nr:MAG: hypothetical protein A2498_06110 [Lentisphaerae bacterium RIFOXYC12_FULL_60_16]
MMKRTPTACGVLLILAATLQAATRTWDGSTGNWTDSARWGGTVPQNGDVAVVNGGSVLLSAGTAALSAYTMGGGTLTFTNWTTLLNATNVTINSGTITLPAAFTNNGMSNRIYVVCSNFTLASAVTINVDGKGYKASPASLGTAHGPGAPPVTAHYGGGAGHGGPGGPGDSIGATGGPVYGETNAPTAPGSGGGGNSVTGHGGGAVRIEATGTVTINGAIRANGGNGTTHGGAGSGGGIFISCAAFSGTTSGQLMANGGNIAVVNSIHGGSGGGGRIAVAVGVSAADVQKLLDGDPVANVYTSDRYGGYAGSFSVSGGTPAGNVGPHNHTGTSGTHRVVVTSSDSTFWLRVLGDPELHDTPTPYGYGINAGFASGTPIVNTVTSPFDDGGGIRRGCLGWAVTNQAGALVASGSGAAASFNMTTNLILTYTWTNIYQLTVTSANAAQGSVNAGTVDGWYTNGVTVANITATPVGAYVFNRWTGTGVPPGQETVNPLTTTMTQPRSLVANFSLPAGEVRNWNGTGNWISGGNWTPNGIPGPRDDARIVSGTVTLHEPHAADLLTVNSGTVMVFTNWATTFAASNVVIGGTVRLPPTFTESMMSNRVYFICTNLTVQSGGLIDVKGRGYRSGYDAWYSKGEGPGGAAESMYYGGGGGHGGKGANGDSAGATGGPVYGVTNAPMAPGSGGGGNSDGGHGGGAVCIAARGTVTIDGTIDADGAKTTTHGGSGSGGSIFISCKTFGGAAGGKLLARGADGYRVSTSHGGAGGGGRIAVAINMTPADVQRLVDGLSVTGLIITTSYPAYLGSVSTTNGILEADGHIHNGDPGIHRFLQVASGSAFSLQIQGDPGNQSAPSPRGYGIHVNIPEGTWITNTVTSPFDDGGGIGWGCLGWSVTNALGQTVAADTDNQAVFEMTTNLFLTYHWTNLYWLAVTSPVPAHGSVNAAAVEGWYTNGTVVANITATSSNGYTFNRWTGTGVPEGQETDNPLSAPMTEPRFLSANFASDISTLRVWTGIGNWTDTQRWTPVGLPSPQDDARIASGTVTVSEPMDVGSLIVSNGATMVFTNWINRLTVNGHVSIKGTVTLPSPYPDGAMSNRVYVACQTFTLDSGGLISASGRGYIGGRGISTTDHGNGPGKGRLRPGLAHYGGGGGHGGVGHAGINGIGGITCGLTNAPQFPGSGGGGNNAGDGGGAVRIAATGRVEINGTINADGSVSLAHGGGGSGGSIFISCRTFEGGGGALLSSKGGGVPYYSASQYGGPGGGGRIAVLIGVAPQDLQRLLDGEETRFPFTTNHPMYLGTASVIGASTGFGQDGGPGTLRFIMAPGSGSLFMIL